MMEPVKHYAVVRTLYGEDRIKSLCGRSRVDIVNVEAIDSGQNVTFEPEKVTCSFCLRILPRRLELERGTK